ncbi:MAG TPA: ATP-grasp domain-containing protein [Gemmatimonadales bacterium]|nr:ATP-grasp domain-containing protein [Gemmatimonadales bacterium]
MPTTTYRTTAFVEAARRLQVDLTVASEQPSTFEHARPDALLTLDFHDPDRAVQQARVFDTRFRLDAALGVDDDTVVIATAINRGLGRPTNPIAAVQAARDKLLQRTLLGGAGVPVPRFGLETLAQDLETAAQRASYPCVVKPLRLSASRGVIRAGDPGEFVAAVHRLGAILESTCDPQDRRALEYLVEDFIPGHEVALEGLLVDGQLQVLALFDKPDPLDGPYFEETIYVTPSRHPAKVQTALVECGQAAARALGLREGPIHAELRFNEQGPWLIELAARPIGGRCSAVLHFGDGSISLEEIVLRHALGMPLPSLDREPGAAAVMMIPVPGAGFLEDFSGVDDAKRVPGVDDVVITAHRGETLVPWPEGFRYPGFIFARGATPDLAERAVREAHHRLHFVIRPASP